MIIQEHCCRQEQGTGTQTLKSESEVPNRQKHRVPEAGTIEKHAAKREFEPENQDCIKKPKFWTGKSGIRQNECLDRKIWIRSKIKHVEIMKS